MIACSDRFGDVRALGPEIDRCERSPERYAAQGSGTIVEFHADARTRSRMPATSMSKLQPAAVRRTFVTRTGSVGAAGRDEQRHVANRPATDRPHHHRRGTSMTQRLRDPALDRRDPTRDDPDARSDGELDDAQVAGRPGRANDASADDRGGPDVEVPELAEGACRPRGQPVLDHEVAASAREQHTPPLRDAGVPAVDDDQLVTLRVRPRVRQAGACEDARYDRPSTVTTLWARRPIAKARQPSLLYVNIPLSSMSRLPYAYNVSDA